MKMAVSREDSDRILKNTAIGGDSDSDNAEIDWEDCNDDELYKIATQCLFCAESFDSPELCWKHCNVDHGYDIDSMRTSFKLDCFSYIKMINYARKVRPTSQEMKCLPVDCWQSDDFLVPVIEDDGLLQFDIESDESGQITVDQSVKVVNPSGAMQLNSKENKSGHFKLNTEELELSLERANEDLKKMKVFAQNLIQSGLPSDPSQSAISTLKIEEDETYTNSYGHFSIHQEMLKDEVRTNFYKNCIYDNKDLFKDKIVLDIGCGTGILSMFAAKAGAKLVIGIEMSDIIYQAMDIIRENGLHEKITLIKGRMEDVTLPVEKVDIIISEWMGYFLLFESMLDTVLWARDHYLNPGGCMIPDFCSISIIGMEDYKQYHDNVKYWDDVYGFKMSSMRSALLEEASVLVVNPENKFTEPCIIKTIDTLVCCHENLDFVNDFSLMSMQDIEVTALVGYFDVSWKKASESMIMPTSPFTKATHWKQTVFLLQHPIKLKCGDKLEGKFTCMKNRKDPRSLIVTLCIQGKSCKYLLQ